MKKIGMKQIMPLILAGIAIVFAYIGFTQLGFWHKVDGPRPGFFPTIMAIVMFFTSILSFVQSLKETKQPKFHKDELIVIASGAGIIAATFIIGLLPSCLLYIVIWLRFFEKTPWKATIIVSVVIMAIVVGVFQVWLGVQFPMGIFEAMM